MDDAQNALAVCKSACRSLVLRGRPRLLATACRHQLSRSFESRRAAKAEVGIAAEGAGEVTGLGRQVGGWGHQRREYTTLNP